MTSHFDIEIFEQLCKSQGNEVIDKDGIAWSMWKILRLKSPKVPAQLICNALHVAYKHKTTVDIYNVITCFNNRIDNKSQHYSVENYTYGETYIMHTAMIEIFNLAMLDEDTILCHFMIDELGIDKFIEHRKKNNELINTLTSEIHNSVYDKICSSYTGYDYTLSNVQIIIDIINQYGINRLNLKEYIKTYIKGSINRTNYKSCSAKDITDCQSAIQTLYNNVNHDDLSIAEIQEEILQIPFDKRDIMQHFIINLSLASVASDVTVAPPPPVEPLVKPTIIDMPVNDVAVEPTATETVTALDIEKEEEPTASEETTPLLERWGLFRRGGRS